VKLRNTSRFSDDAVRWAIGVAKTALTDTLPHSVSVWVKNRSGSAFSGHAYSGSRRIVASIGPDSRYPTTFTYRQAVPNRTVNDAVEGLVSILAHELQHQVQYAMGEGGNEVEAELTSERAVATCRARRGEVDMILRLAAEVAAQAQPVDRLAAMAEGRAKAAEARLARLRSNVLRWEAKLARAQRALKKLRPKLRASEKRAAARSGP
jgi:hypothetical protein